MSWLDSSKFNALSSCKRYELAGRYINGHFAWRGRVIQADELIASSQDRGYVKLMCELHAARLDAQVAA